MKFYQLGSGVVLVEKPKKDSAVAINLAAPLRCL
jgi:hypothetical protein